MKNILFHGLIGLLTISFSQMAKSSTLPEKTQTVLEDSLTLKLQQAYQKGSIMGFSVAVVHNDRLIYENGFGYRDIEQTNAYNSHSIQNIASISKTLIGLSLFKAQEMGKLHINDPINRYLPFEIVNPNAPETPILIKHLAYHTSSITDLDEIYAKSYVLTRSEHAENEGVFDYFNAPETKISLLDFIQNSLTKEGKWYKKESFLAVQPGEMREYSNIAAALCALVIESATGQDYRSFTKEYITKPLKMTNSGWSSNDIDAKQRSRLFAHKDMMIADYDLITYADGGFLTSSHDLGLYLSELIKGYNGNGRLLRQESYDKLFEKQPFITDGETAYYGAFIEFRDGFLNDKKESIGHNGSDPGVFTALYFNPITHIGKVLLVNTDTDFTPEVWPEIKEIWQALSQYETSISKP